MLLSSHQNYPFTLYTDSGLPKGVFNVVQGQGVTGGALTSHPDVAKVRLFSPTVLVAAFEIDIIVVCKYCYYQVIKITHSPSTQTVAYPRVSSMLSRVRE